MRQFGGDVNHCCDQDSETDDRSENYNVEVDVYFVLDLPMTAHTCLQDSALGWQSLEEFLAAETISVH
jgi:hypothetical protein